MTKTLTTRAPDALVREIEALAREEHLDKSALIRRLLAEALHEKRKEKALEQYRDGKVSIGKAASIARVSIWEFMDLVREKGLHIDYGSEELYEDLEPLRREDGASRK
jgi:predicted HTH domain antitoxin